MRRPHHSHVGPRAEREVSTARARSRRAFRVGLTLAMPIALFWLAGCGGGYKGGKISQAPATAIVLFDVEGPYGPELTDLLAAEIPGVCWNRVVVVKARDKPHLVEALGEGTAASYVREMGAQAYILGEITRSERVNGGQYVLAGRFEVYDAETETQVGLVPNAETVGHLDVGVDWAKSDLGPSDAQRTHEIFAYWAATLLARGLGY